MFTVRVVSAGEKSSIMRDTKYETKRRALTAIEKLGELNWIRRMGKTYIVQPKSSK